MYIRNIYIENYGAIGKLNYAMPFDENGKPLPVVVVGKNGTGKTLFLSNILDALIEIKREFYNNLSDVSGNNFFRISSKKYIKDVENHAYLRMDFDNAYKTEVMVKQFEVFKENFNLSNYPDVNISASGFKENGFYSKVKKPETNVFNNNIYLYFPVDRYYIPTWENVENEKLSFSTDADNILGRDESGIVQYDLLKDLETWLLDVIIDKMLYESKLIGIKIKDDYMPYQVFEGKNNNIQNALNDILTKMFSNKQYTHVRIGISEKQHRKIAVMGRLIDGKEEEIVPKFSNLSSGEIMILGIFSSIIRAYDKVTTNATINFSTVSGVVLIDEIDAHLHSDLLKDVLPNLIKMFPKIQFIISSHSPFFLLGMKEVFGEDCKFVALPTGTTLDTIDKFDEIRKCYSIIDDSYKSVLKTLEQYEKQVKDLSKPLIITEGKTDWKHLKHALRKLQEDGEFNELDVRFLEYEYDFSDSKLETLLGQLSKVPNPNKIIGIFDSDSSTGCKYKDTKNFGNNVYGCCITDTQGYNCGISIELLYSRDDLTREDNNKRRIYLSDEFKEKSHQLTTDATIVCHSGTLIDAFKRNIIKVVTSDVFDSAENSLALSKESFARYILDEDQNFNDISVEGFKPIFSLIQDIINNSL